MSQKIRTISGHPNYGATSTGEVYRITPYVGIRWKTRKTPRKLKVRTWSNGYKYVAIEHRGTVRLSVHRAVALAFLGPPPKGKPCCCHNDGNKSNNKFSNLRWDSRRGNMSDQLKHKTRAQGEKNGQAKLEASQVLQIRTKLRSGHSVGALANEYEMSHQAISDIKKRRRWRHI